MEGVFVVVSWRSQKALKCRISETLTQFTNLNAD